MKKQTLNTLKDYAKFRILDDMIQTVSANAGNPLGYYILVVDPESVKVLSSICKMYDLVSYNVSTIEQLMLDRKRFPNADAIYLMSPCKASVERLLKDFSDPAHPQYNYVHLCLLGPLSQDLFALLGSSPGLVPRIKTLKELNINFLIKESEIFHFGYTPNLSIYSAKESATWISGCADKLMTVCCTFLENPYIQYYGDSPLCKQLATTLHHKLGELMKRAGPENKPHDPRGTVIVVDRAYDLNSPVMHDYCYEVILHDLLQITKEGAIDPENLTRPWSLEDQKEEKKEGAAKKKFMFIGEADPLWKQYRYMHIAEMFKKLSADVKEFVRTNNKMRNIGDDSADLDKLQEVMVAMPNYKEILDSYQCHIKIATECSKQYKEKNYIELIKLEQQIATGVEADGTDLDTKKVATAIGRLLTDYKDISEEDLLRVYLMYLANYDVPKREAESLAKSFKDEKNKDVFLSKIVWLGYRWPGSDMKKPQRRSPKIKHDEFEMARQKSEESKMAEIMFMPRVAKIAMEASKKTLSTDEFPFVGEVPEEYGKKKVPKSIGTSIKRGKPAVSIFSEERGSEDLWQQPRIILFVIGGLSHQETSALFKLQQSKYINCPLTVGSDCIITPKDYLDSLKRIGEFQLEIGDI